MATQKRLLSGVKPTGRPHIGNYFGSMRQFVELQDSYESFVFLADYHALNFIQNGEEMRENIMEVARDYLGIGLNPGKTTIFKQSDIAAHTELAWIFDTITTVPYLMRAHAYKDAESKGKEVSVGTFNYPMLMAADILLYDPNVVPVGQDQKQHVEYARDTAQKFNHIYGELFRLPEALIVSEVATVPGVDGRKMSKSYGNTIPLFGTKDEITQAVMSIVTDSTGAFPEHVHAIHKLYRSEGELQDMYAEHSGNYKKLKEILIEDIEAIADPMRKKRASVTDDMVREILAKGAARAREVTSSKMEMVRRTIGVTL